MGNKHTLSLGFASHFGHSILPNPVIRLIIDLASLSEQPEPRVLSVIWWSLRSVCRAWNLEWKHATSLHRQIKVLHENNTPLPPVYCIAMYAGHQQLASSIYQDTLTQEPFLNQKLFYAAVRGNHLAIIEQLDSEPKPCPWDKQECFEIAVELDYLPIAQWIVGKHRDLNFDTIYKQGVRSGSTRMVQWLIEQGMSTDELCQRLIFGTHVISMLEWAQTEALPWFNLTSSVVCQVAAIGNLEVLEWLHANNGTFNTHACSKAASAGNLKVLKWLREHNCSWTVNAHYMAIDHGHFEVLEWLVENKYPIDKWVLPCFAKNINLYKDIATSRIRRTLNILVKDVLSIDSYSNMIIDAVLESQVEVLNYLIGIHNPYITICSLVVCNNDLASLKWLYAHCDKKELNEDEVVLNAIIQNNIPILEWLHVNGHKFSALDTLFVASEGNLELLKWFQKHDCEWNENVCWKAARQGHIEVLAWLIENGCPADKNVLRQYTSMTTKL